MSAIAGIYYFGAQPVPIEQSQKLMAALRKFPADDVQAWHNANIFLGCHAQWITPESVGERLPYYDYEKKLAITADAILDNRAELFDKLQVSQSQRKMISDSELILLAYSKWGSESPKYLLGDFAYAIWDERKRLLFGARDFSGSRTLYFHRGPQQFAFCTIIEPLFTLGHIAKRLNEQWIAEFVAIPDVFDSLAVTSTVYRDIEQVPPAHTIIVADGQVNLSQFCVVTDVKPVKLKSNQEYVEAFQEVFQSAVNSRLRTHREIGAHLSGGLDSGSVVSYAAKTLRKANKRLHTFSYVPPEDFVDWTPSNFIADERPMIKSTVQYVGNIDDSYFDFKGKNPLTEMDDLLEIMEMPYKFFENSFWLKGIYQKAKEQGIGILLNGARGNLTISWGPAVEYYSGLLKKLKWIKFWRELFLYSVNINSGRSRTVPVILRSAFPLLRRFYQSEEMSQFPIYINPELAKRTDVFKKIKEHDVGLDKIEDIYKTRKRHFTDYFYYNSACTAETKLSLLNSLWSRDPTNDLRVVRFCFSVPEEQYVQNGFDRALIRRATENYLPDDVRLNMTVRGCQGVDWVHRMASFWGPFVEELQQLCTDPVSSEIFNVSVLRAALSKVRAGPLPQFAMDPEYRILIRCLVVYRFIKKLT